jgi:hypothetical protein
MSLINHIINYYSNRNKPSVERKQVDNRPFMAKAVNEYIDEHSNDGGRILLDGAYYVASKQDMRAVIESDQTDKRPYKKNTYDCENFALSFMAGVQKEYGLTNVGLVIDWSGGHSYNMIVYDNGEVDLYEPQSDEFVEPGEEDKYAFEQVRVLI